MQNYFDITKYTKKIGRGITHATIIKNIKGDSDNLNIAFLFLEIKNKKHE